MRTDSLRWPAWIEFLPRGTSLAEAKMVSIWWLMASFVVGGWLGIVLGALIYMSAGPHRGGSQRLTGAQGVRLQYIGARHPRAARWRMRISTRPPARCMAP